MKLYLNCLAAYLTGIGVVTVIHSLSAKVRREEVKEEIASYVADRLIDRLESRDRKIRAVAASSGAFRR